MKCGARKPLAVAKEFPNPHIRPANGGATYNILGQYDPEKAISVVAPTHIVKITTNAS